MDIEGDAKKSSRAFSIIASLILILQKNPFKHVIYIPRRFQNGKVRFCNSKVVGAKSFLVEIWISQKFTFCQKNLLNPPLPWGIVYTVAQCTDVSNSIFAIKQGDLEKTLEV